MRHLALLIVPLLIVAAGCAPRGKKQAAPTPKNYSAPLAPGAAGIVLTDMSELPPVRTTPTSRAALTAAAQRSLKWLGTSKKAGEQIAKQTHGIGAERVRAGLERLVVLLESTRDDGALDAAIRSEFALYRSVGCDNAGTVLFTGYYTPILDASLTRTERFRFPLYGKPGDLQSNPGYDVSQQRLPDGSLRPYPTAQELERSDALTGSELLWLEDEFDAYSVRVQGSARVRIDGSERNVGFAGTNGHPYTGLNAMLVKDGKMQPDQISYTNLRRYFREHPGELAGYAARNPRLTFFAFTKEGPYGCLGETVPVEPDVSIATDKDIFPPRRTDVRQPARTQRAAPRPGPRRRHPRCGALRSLYGRWARSRQPRRAAVCRGQAVPTSSASDLHGQGNLRPHAPRRRRARRLAVRVPAPVRLQCLGWPRGNAGGKRLPVLRHRFPRR